MLGDKTVITLGCFGTVQWVRQYHEAKVLCLLGTWLWLQSALGNMETGFVSEEYSALLQIQSTLSKVY